MDNDYEVHLKDGDPRRLVIAWAGGTQNVFQFKNVLNNLNVSHVLMRDCAQKYHGKGVAGIGDREKVLEYVRYWTKRRWVTHVGVSTGAYAALLYGQLAPVDRVIAISPLSGREVDDFEPRWHKQIIDPDQPDMDDLRKYFRSGPVPKVTAYVSDGEATELDRQMATRVNISDIVLIPGYSHSALARGMRDKGMFKEMFKDMFT